MSYYFAEKLDLFADLATSNNLEEGHHYLDPSDPDNVHAAQVFFDKELGFLRNRDKEELLEIWQLAVEDCLNTKLLFNAIKILKDKYGHNGSNLGFPQ